jgi:hypothetical protein
MDEAGWKGAEEVGFACCWALLRCLLGEEKKGEGGRVCIEYVGISLCWAFLT